MRDHVITVERWNAGIAVFCSCHGEWGKTLAEYPGFNDRVPLTDLIQVSREHLEAAYPLKTITGAEDA